MGNWHCVPSGCAEVVYREYLPPRIRYRYPGEQWQEILFADNYSVVSNWKYETSNDFNYIFTAKAKCSTSSPPPGVAPNVPRSFVAGQEIIVTTNGTWSGPILGFEKFTNGTNVNGKISYTERTGGNLTIANCAPRTIEVILSTRSTSSSVTVRLKSVEGSFAEPVVAGSIYDVQFIPTTTPPRACINSVTNQCTFKVFKQGQVVYEETRSVCPEVQKISCQISDEVKTIQVEKLPLLERVEVVDWAYQVFGANIYRANIPSECLNVYKNGSAVIIPLPGGIPTPANYLDTDAYGYITQICSAPGCPPPEYGVVCNDECLECIDCPPGTHPLVCDDIVCCYGSDGKVVQEIPKADYCGGDSCCE